MAAAALVSATAGTQDAVANGDTRTLSFYHTHTRESTTVTFRRNGQYDRGALAQLNWFLRDWRVNEQIKMDPRLFDILWEVYREAGSSQPIHIISAYRSPETNGALRRRSKGVSENSQHMLGKAMDVRMPDVDTGRLRAIAMRVQYGGVGYYPSSQFVHIDTGSVRAWPRMSQEQLARLFPDGKTLHLPPSGKPLPGYEQARAEIPARNAALAAQASAGGGSIGSLMAGLLGSKNPTTPAARPAEATAALAYAAPTEPEPAPVAAPLPPSRPLDLRLVGDSDTPSKLEQRAAIATAPIPSPIAPPRPKPVLGLDERGALQALFDPTPFVTDLSFSSQSADQLSTTQFTGSAVKPLTVSRRVEANL